MSLDISLGSQVGESDQIDDSDLNYIQLSVKDYYF